MAITKSNPYAPPRRARSDAAQSTYTRGLLSALALSLVVGGFRSLLYLGVAAGFSGGEGLVDPFDRAFLWSWQLKRALFVVALVAYSLWIHRSNREARSRGAALVLSPGWAVAVSFLPVVNLIAPYRAVKEILEVVSRSHRASIGLSAAALARLWWGLWITTLAWTPVSGLLSHDDGLWREVTGEALWALAALALIAIVRRIDIGFELSEGEQAVFPSAR